MTKDEALQMCLEYIETNAHERRHVRWAIKEALAQPPLPVQRQQTVETLEKELEDMIRERDKRNAVLSDIANLIGVEFSSAYRFADLVDDLSQSLAAQPLPVQPEQSVAGYCKKIQELIVERDRLRAALAQPVQPEQDFKTATKKDAPLVKWAKEQTPPLPVQPVQEPVAWRIRCTNPMRDWVLMYHHPKTQEQFSNMEIQPLYTTPPLPVQPEQEPVAWEQFHEHLVERNFCPRCGKRTADLTTIHTCTPPQENT